LSFADPKSEQLLRQKFFWVFNIRTFLMRASGTVLLLQHAVKTYNIGSSVWAALAAVAFIVQYIGLALALNQVGCDVPANEISPLAFAQLSVFSKPWHSQAWKVSKILMKLSALYFQYFCGR